MDPYIKNKKRITPAFKGLDTLVIIPTDKLSHVLSATEIVNRYKITDKMVAALKDKKNKGLEEKLFAVGTALLGSQQCPPANMLENFEKDPDREFDNATKFEDKKLEIRNIDIKSKKKGKVTGKIAGMKAYSFLGLGGIMQIPLWHSGFWITLGNISSTDIVNLNYKLADNTVNLGRDTNGLIFSNDSVIFNRIILEFILDHMIDSTLDLDGVDIRTVIKTPDISLLALGLISAMQPNGFNVLLSCRNSLTPTEDHESVECGYTISALLDPKKILMVDKKALSDENKLHMTKRTSNAYLLEDVETYQKSISRISDKDFTVEHNGKELKLTLTIPSMLDYINSGELWIENIKDTVNATIGEEANDLVRQGRYSEMYTQTVLNTYGHYIKRLYVSDDEYIEGGDLELVNVLNTYALDSDLALKIMNVIKDYINSSVIAMVGTNVYVCPKCKKDNEDSNTIDAFKEIVPLDILKVFFDLSTLR